MDAVFIPVTLAAVVVAMASTVIAWRMSREDRRRSEARIAALERLVGRLTLENDFLKGASRQATRLPRSAATFVIAGPVASPSAKDAD